MTAPALLRASASRGATVLETAPRRRRSRGSPPGLPPDDGGGGGDGGGGEPGGREPFASGAGALALALALLGIATLFAVLIAVWLLLRRPAPDWKAGGAEGALDALWISSACLLGSSAALERAVRRAREGPDQRRGTLRWLGASVGLGLAFVAAQLHLWSTLWRAGLVPAASGYAAVFFALTGLHALHVLGGLGFLGALALRCRTRAAHPPGPASVRLGAVYWHFMGAIWLILFSLLYFVR